ncbi:hypothetical protein [Faecalibacterium langellae]|uniref:hypothetical protein n=1 Tax=Faecalibacterium langellae TaxID=3435293 RepID=UPI00117BD16F|nr:hypothetical protein [Faecalibacterium prausnitzii]
MFPPTTTTPCGTSFCWCAPDPDTPRAVRFLPVEAPLVGWVLPAGPERAAWKALCVFYNPLAETRVVSLPEGRWKLLSDGTSSTL